MAKSFLTPINLNKLELQNAVIQNLASAPSSPVAGLLYFDTTDDVLKIHNGTDFIALGAAGTLSYAAPGATINAGDAASEGVATTVLRSDAQFAVATAAASTISGSNAEGASTSFARADHNHALGSGVVGTTQLASGVRLDSINAPTASVNLNSQKITGLADGTVASDAVNLGQLQAAQAGLDVKASVRVATTAAGTLATSFENGDTVDGVVLTTGDRILVKDQAAPAENGIRVVAASGAPARATDFDSWAEIPGAFVTVEEGTANADTVWLSTANQGGTLNTTAITFVQWEVGVITAGGGLTKTGNSLDVVGTSNRITVNADSIDIAATYVGQTSITTLGTITSGTWNGTDIAVADGGTGAGTAAGARTNLVAAGYYSSATHSAGTTITIPQATHGLRATRGLIVRAQIESTGEIIEPDYTVASSGDVTVGFAVSQGANTIRVTILG